jgi:hypothetical protein
MIDKSRVWHPDPSNLPAECLGHHQTHGRRNGPNRIRSDRAPIWDCQLTKVLTGQRLGDSITPKSGPVQTH